MGPQVWGKEEKLRQSREMKQLLIVGEKYVTKTSTGIGRPAASNRSSSPGLERGGEGRVL